MDRLEASKREVKNMIPETTVLVVFGKEFFGNLWTDNFLWFFAVENGKLVLEVGTDFSEDYYPSFLSVFYPENLPANEANEDEVRNER
jgi:hypothetical protein